MSLRRIRKRDGSEVPFDKARIRAAVAAAQAAVGEQDETFAGEVADLVELALRRRYGLEALGLEIDPEREAFPNVEEVQDLVELALIELGRAAVAKAYILYRDRRARVREARGVREETPGQRGALKHVRVNEAERSSAWSKGRIIAALVDEAGLSRSLAEEVARRVELRVVSSGLKRISTGLVRELVDNELVAMSLATALARHEPVAVPRHDLRQLLEYGPPPPSAGLGRPVRYVPGERLGEDSVAGAVAAGVLRRYALEDLFDEQSSELHTRGELHVEDVRRPHLHLVQSVPAELLLRGQPGARSAFELLDELARLTASVARGVVLEAPAALLQPLARGARADGYSGLAGWLGALRALARATARRFDLSRPGARAAALVSRLVDELARLADSAEPGPVPRLFLDRAELHALLEHRRSRGEESEPIDQLLAAGVLVPVWGRGEELFAGPGCRRRGREQGAVACGGAVALNLLAVARRAGPWREDLALEELARGVEAAVETLAQLARFQREARAARAGEARGRVAYAITPVGLREALRVLGDGELRPDQGARLLGLLADAARRFSASRGLSVVLSPFFGRRAAARFAQLDAERPRVSQGLLFGELAHGAAERAYSLGFDLGVGPERSAGGPPGVAEAELLATVATGAWLDPATLYGRARDPREAGSPLAAWSRFDRTREERDQRAAAQPLGDAAALGARADEAAALFSAPVVGEEHGA